MNEQQIFDEWVRKKDVVRLCKFLFPGVKAAQNVTPYQAKIIRAIAYGTYRRLSVCAMTRYGKSQAIGLGSALYILFHKNKRVALLAPTNDQAKIIRDYLVELIIACDALSDLADFEVTGVRRLKREMSKTRVTFKNGCSYQIYSVEGKADRLMGFGGDLIILDEACLISKDAYAKLFRMTGDDPKHSVIVESYNPWNVDNKAYDHFMSGVNINDMEKLPEDHEDRRRYCTIHVNWKTALKEGRTTKEFIEDARKEITKLEFQVLYDSDFPDQSEDSIFSRQEIEKAEASTLNLVQAIKDGQDKRLFRKIIACDVADTGLDETVIFIGYKRGRNEYQITDHFHDATINVAEVRRKLEHYIALSLKEGIKIDVHIDGQGVGIGVVRELQEELRQQKLKDRVRIVDCRGGGTPINKDTYSNKKAENMFRLKYRMEENEIKILKIPN